MTARDPYQPYSRNSARPLILLVVCILAFIIVRDGCRRAGPRGTPRPVTPPTGELGADERATIQVFDRVAPSVVWISNTALRRSPFTMSVLEVPQGMGSGFVWDLKGHVVTNCHVILKADSVKVMFQDQSEHDAVVVGYAPDYDLAVLKISAPAGKLQPVMIGKSSDLRVGQKVLAIGNPFGLDHSLTTGIISALGRTIKSLTDRMIYDAIQTDAAINPGNSGGPMLDSFGRLIGVNTQIYSRSGMYGGIGFAVPIDTVNRVVPQLIAKGQVARVGLGVTVLQGRFAARYGQKGAILVDVPTNGAAGKAGLRGMRRTGRGKLVLGDVIVAVESNKIDSAGDLMEALEQYSIADEVAIEYLRDGQRREAIVKLQAIE